MKFCPKCGNMMYPKKDEEKVVLVCRECGHEMKGKGDESESYKLSKEGKKKKETAVIEKDTENMPKTTNKCPECGHDKAYWWMQQTRSADEPSTRFYRCVKCGKTWREY